MHLPVSRTLCACIVLTCWAGACAAQSVIAIKLGTFNPEDAKHGFIVGITTARQVDERVDFGLSADLFVRQFEQETTVGDDPSGGTIKQTEIDYSMYALPIMVQFNVRILPEAVVKPYVGLSGGYEIVFSRERNYEDDIKDNRLYGGFGWRLMLGGEYPMGGASALLGEIFYNGCTVKRSKGTSGEGYPIHEELGFSGLGLRLGVRFGGF